MYVCELEEIRILLVCIRKKICASVSAADLRIH